MLRRVIWASLALGPIVVLLHYVSDIGDVAEFVLASIALIPLALKGVAYRAVGAAELLRRNLLIYGLGGLIIPFIGIKLVDMAVSALHLI